MGGWKQSSSPRSDSGSGSGRLFELVSDAVIVASATSGRVVLWNPSAAAMFGVKVEDAVGMPLLRIVPEPLRERHAEGLARYARGESSGLIDSHQSVELPAIRADGSSLWIELQLSSVPPSDESNGADERHVIAIIRDITARKAAEAEVVSRNDQLRAMNEDLRNFLAAAAHDIVGPAGGMRGAAELIASSTDLDDARELGALIARQANLVVELGRDLGQMSVIEQGSVPTRPSDLLVSEVVETARVMSDQLYSDGDVVVRVAPELRWYADPTHATRIVANLISNARKYGRPPVVVEAMPGDRCVELRIRDAGDGVPDAFTHKLFDKFTRANVRGDGLGLGLAICRGLAQANDGNVWYEHSDEPGATFVVRLPDRA